MLVESLRAAKAVLAEGVDASSIASAITKAVKSAGFEVSRMRAQAAGQGAVRLLVRAHPADEPKVVKAVAGVAGLKKVKDAFRSWEFASDDGVSVSVHESASMTLTGVGGPEDVMEVTIAPAVGNWGGYD